MFWKGSFSKERGKSIILFTGKRRGGKKSLLDIINVVADKFDQEQPKVKAVLLSSSSFPQKKSRAREKKKNLGNRVNTVFFGGGNERFKEEIGIWAAKAELFKAIGREIFTPDFPKTRTRQLSLSLSPVQKNQKRLNPHFRWGNRACVRASRKKLSLFMIEKTQLLPLSIRKHKISTSFFPYFFIFSKKANYRFPLPFRRYPPQKSAHSFFRFFLSRSHPGSLCTYL